MLPGVLLVRAVAGPVGGLASGGDLWPAPRRRPQQPAAARLLDGRRPRHMDAVPRAGAALPAAALCAAPAGPVAASRPGCPAIARRWRPSSSSCRWSWRCRSRTSARTSPKARPIARTSPPTTSWRRAVVAEVAKGDVPPVNPFYIDDPLHYYWLPHLATAVTYRNTPSDLDDLLLVNSVIVDVAFVAFLFGLARWFAPRPWAAALGVAGAILCTSYEGLFTLVQYWSWHVPLVLVRDLNIDAVVRWYSAGHADRRPAARAVLSAPSRHRLRDGLSRRAGDRRTHPPLRSRRDGHRRRPAGDEHPDQLVRRD